MSGVIFISHKAVLTIAVILKSNWQSVCMWEVDGENLWGGNSTPVDSRSQQKWRGRHHGCGFQASEGWTASDVWSVQLLRNLVFFYLKIQVFEFGICLSSSSHQKEQDISLQLNFLKLLFPSESNPRNEIWTDIFENGRTLHNGGPPPPPTCWCMQHLQRACQGWVGILNKFSGTRKLADHWPAGFNVEPLPYRSCDHLLPIMPPYQQPQHTISLQHKSRFGLSCHLWQAPGPFWNDYKIITFLVSLSLWATLIQNRVLGARCHRK